MSTLASSASSLAVPSKKQRLDFIEALRGLAALYVVVFHLVQLPTPPLETPFWLTKIIGFGGSGVSLFFVVSAFTLTLSMRLHEQEAYPTRRFYLRRVFRIVPLFYVWSVLAWIRDKVFLRHTTTWMMLLLSSTFTFNLVPGYQEGFVWASWTLGVEMLFYLFFPLIYRHINNLLKASIFFAATVILSGMYSYFLHLYYHPASTQAAVQIAFVLQRSLLHQLPIFAMGMVAFYVFEKFIQNKSRPRSWGVALLATSAVLYIAAINGLLRFLIDPIYWQAILYSLLLLGLSIFPIGLLVNRLTLFWGKLSYSLYLNHPTLVYALIPIYRKIYTLPMPLALKLGACFLLVLGLLTPLSYLSYRFIEKPGMQLGTKLIQKFATHPVVSLPDNVEKPEPNAVN